MPRSKPILLTLSVIAGLHVLLGGAALADFVDVKLIGLVALVVAAFEGGLAVYLSGSNISAPQVVATQLQPGAPVVAGPASAVSTGHTISPEMSVADVATPNIPVE